MTTAALAEACSGATGDAGSESTDAAADGQRPGAQSNVDGASAGDDATGNRPDDAADADGAGDDATGNRPDAADDADGAGAVDAGLDGTAIADADAGGDAGSDAAACYVSCLSSGSSSPDGAVTTSCRCKATCDGHAYEMLCTNGACACTQDLVLTASPAGGCDSSEIILTTYNTACGYPGVPRPKSCSVSCGGASQPSSDGGDASVKSCSCGADCNGHSYKAACTAGDCTCSTDGVPTATVPDDASCGATFTIYSTSCGYPGSPAPVASDGGGSGGEAGPPPSDGG